MAWKRAIHIAAVAILCALPLPAQNAESKAAPRRMAADADPSFEVATIRPNHGAPFSLLNLRGNHYVAQNVSLNDLVKFAYRLHASEVVGLPEWATQERYDLAATTQPEGTPSFDQLRTMLKKFLADRFKLTSHIEQRVLPVYLMTVAAGGPKMKLTQIAEPMNAVHVSEGGVEVIFRGTVPKGYADFLQQAVVDRPVVDRTGLTDRYDYEVTFLPDETMFGGQMHLPPNFANAAPSLYTALQEIGLKLTPDKAAVDVIVVDHAEKPSEN